MAPTLVESLLAAYTAGYFPMADPDRPGHVDWYNPDPRAVIPLDSFVVPRSLRQRVRSGRFDVRANTAFSEVITACAEPRHDDDETWISQDIVDAYSDLHDAGYAHSVEAWLVLGGREELVGGLYGVSIAGFFAGESMFSRPMRGGTDASKVCLVHLVDHMARRGMTLLDTQFWNPHLDQFGCVEIRRDDYLRRLESALHLDVRFAPFEPIQAVTDEEA